MRSCCSSCCRSSAISCFSGGQFGLRYVPTRDWGGFMVTIILSYVGIVVSLPLGVVLALGRRSHLPVVKLLCVIFIEMVRGVPLITVLFMATKMLPLFMPNNMKIDDFLCVLIGVALFASAYMAEVIRGGLQAMPKGQYEGADSLGLGYWQKMRLIILPQALKLVIPGIVNTFIGLFKDTSLVYIVNMFDLLGAVRRNFNDANWITPQTPITGLIFAGFVFWMLLLRHVALFDLHGTPARHRPQTIGRNNQGKLRWPPKTQSAPKRSRSISRRCTSPTPTSRSRSSACTNGTATSTC